MTVATTPASIEATPVITVDAAPSPKLWRLALVGLGPLTAMGVFAVLTALFQRLA
jgi:hypothetical protein